MALHGITWDNVSMCAKVKIQELIDSRQPKVGDVLFIAVDGHGGSGKSTFATLLGEKLQAQIIRQDDFASWDNPLNWWPILIERVFEPIKNGATTLSYSRSKWWENHNPEPVVDQPVTKVMILEGVSSFRKEFRDYISLGFFVDTPKELCLKRGIARDTSTGKSTQELTEMWNKWFEEEGAYISRDKPKEHADVVIDGTRPFEDQVG